MADKEKYEVDVSGFKLSVLTPAVVIESNTEKLVAFIRDRVKDYSPEKYAGDADAAKKDRAELNKGAEQVKNIRQQIQALNPYGSVIEQLADAEKLIKSGADALGNIVKARQQEEQDAKRKLIEAEFASRKFDLFKLEKIFDKRWLNKTYKMTDIAAEITAAIDRTYRDLKTIEDFAGADADVLKAHYLISLDIGETMDYGEELRKKQELAAKEEVERAEREHVEQITAQKKELAAEVKDYSKRQTVVGLAAGALDEDAPAAERREYTLTVGVTEPQLMAIKNFLNQQGIEFECQELVF